MSEQRRILPPAPKAPRKTAFTRLTSAAADGDLEALRKSATPKLCQLADARGSSALNWAACMGHTACVRFLIPLSNPRHADIDGVTPLMSSAMNGYRECAELLLPHSDPNAQDAQGYSALMHAAANNRRSCVEILMGNTHIQLANRQGQTASDLALAKGYPDLALLADSIALARMEGGALLAQTPKADDGTSDPTRL